MATLAVAVPAVPAIGWGLLALAEAVTFVVCLGLLWSWKRSIGRAFVWLGNKSIHASVRGIGFTVAPFHFLLDLNESIIGYLGQAVGASEHAMAYSFHRMVGIIVWTAQETAGLATDVYNAIAGTAATAGAVVTKTLDAKTTALVKKIQASVATLTHVTIPALRARVRALEHRIARTVHATAGAIAAPFPRIGRLERTVKAQSKRLTRVEKLLAGGLGVAVLVKALSKLGLGFLRCPSVTRAFKRRQCIDYDFLDALLTGALLIVGTISLVEFAEEVQSVTEEASGLIHGFLRDA